MLLVFSSCEEVIEIDLNSSNPRMVVEGNINLDSIAKIRLSYTTDYFHNEDPVLIDNAIVVLSDDRGNVEQLSHYGMGYYYSYKIRGMENTEYELSITVEDEEYVGETRLFPEPDIASIYYGESFFQAPTAPGDTFRTNYNITINILDDPDEENYYLLNFSRNNGGYQAFYLTTSDDFVSEQGFISFTTFMFEFNLGDTVGINVQSIDQDSYWFLNEMNDAIGVGPSAMSTPYNPHSNFGEGVLGYFMARSQRDTVIYIREIPGFPR